ncbi:MAG: ACT domain-containing protein [Bacteroidota bacterium]
MTHILELRTIPGQFGICKLQPGESIPLWAMSGNFWSVTRTENEVSVVCPQEQIPRDVEVERNWRVLQVVGPLTFEMTGVLLSLAAPLADAGVSIYSVSTFETDFILIQEKSFEIACRTLTKAGHNIV